MRPATMPAMRNILPAIGAAIALVVLGHAAGGRVVRDRCIAAARTMPLQGGKTAGAELARIAPGGTWSIGPLGADEARPVVYTASDRWEWSCRDEAMRPSFVAVSPRARELTPERYFP